MGAGHGETPTLFHGAALDNDGRRREGRGKRTSFALHAEIGSATNGVLQNDYLHEGAARTIAYDLEVDFAGGNYSYKEDTVMEMAAHGGAVMHHTDQNTLQKI